jgi:hypothetical protein
LLASASPTATILDYNLPFAYEKLASGYRLKTRLSHAWGSVHTFTSLWKVADANLYRPCGDLITKLAPVPYDALAPCAVFEKFIHQIFSGRDQLIRYVQACIGYSLTGDVGEKGLFFFYGVGDNGKTTSWRPSVTCSATTPVKCRSSRLSARSVPQSASASTPDITRHVLAFVSEI